MMVGKVKILFLALVFLVKSGHGGDITDISCDCGSTMGAISQVTMQGCDANVASGYCPAPKGTLAHGQFTFTPSVDIDSFSCDMSTSIVPGVGIPCPVSDGCRSIANNVTCPIKAGTKVVYNIDIEVLSLYPQMQLLGNINLRLNKQDRNDAICMQLPIDILPEERTTTPLPHSNSTSSRYLPDKPLLDTGVLPFCPGVMTSTPPSTNKTTSRPPRPTTTTTWQPTTDDLLDKCQAYTTKDCSNLPTDHGAVAWINTTTADSCFKMCEDYGYECNTVVFRPYVTDLRDGAGDCQLWSLSVEEYLEGCQWRSGWGSQQMLRDCKRVQGDRSCQAFRWSDCKYLNESRANGRLEMIPSEEMCNKECRDDRPCYHYEYNPFTQTCLLYHGSDFPTTCNNIVGPPIPQAVDCMTDMRLPY